MTVESNYVIAIGTLRDWLKRLAPVFQPMRIKTKNNVPYLLVYKSTFYDQKISPKNRPRLIHESYTKT